MAEPAPYEFSIVIPAYNEEGGIRNTIEHIVSTVPGGRHYEIVVVNDGSSDNTRAILGQLDSEYPNLHVFHHEVNRGYGAALKTGIRHASSAFIAITDADGTYPNERIPEFVDKCVKESLDMVVGARTGDDVTYSKIRAIPKFFLKRWVSWLAARNVPDINSGLRVFRKEVAERFFGILSDKFSFTITITLAMLTTYRQVEFVPINYSARIGKSKIKPFRDTMRFVVLILRTGAYFAPVRAFAPIIGVLFLLAVISLLYDVFVISNLSDKTTLLFLFSLNVGMFAMLADMIDKRIS